MTLQKIKGLDGLWQKVNRNWADPDWRIPEDGIYIQHGEHFYLLRKLEDKNGKSI